MHPVSEDRINRVVDYIQNHLNETLSIEQLAKLACFSAFHFNRVFKDAMGESVYQFIKRLRLEKAAESLLTQADTSITEIALNCGYSNSSSFAKSFQAHFNMSAQQWRKRSRMQEDDQSDTPSCQVCIVNGLPVWTFHHEDFIRQVVIEVIPPSQFAYIRNVGSYEGDADLFEKLYAKLFQWAIPRGYIQDNTHTLNVYHDHPGITEKSKLRVMVGIEVRERIPADGSIGVTQLSGGKYAVCRFLLQKQEFAQAWDWMLRTWLKISGFEMDEREALERCHGEKTLNDTRFYEVDICIPVKPK